MASSSCVTQITINFHYGGVFEANPVLYNFGMLKKLKNVDLISMDYSQVVSYLQTQSHSICKGLYFFVPGKNLEDGLRSLKNDDGVRNCRQYAPRNNVEIDIYMAHSEFSEHITADSDVSESEDDVYYVSFDNDETASLDHLTDGEDEVVEYGDFSVLKPVAVMLRYVATAWWRPAFNVYRDQGILPLPNDVVLVSILVVQFLVSEKNKPDYDNEVVPDLLNLIKGSSQRKASLRDPLTYSVIVAVLRYAILAFWRPAFNILRDHEILPLPNDFVSMFV
ncbi:hypothetical protein Tco_0638535 [Tanacetum coccineum]